MFHGGIALVCARLGTDRPTEQTKASCRTTATVSQNRYICHKRIVHVVVWPPAVHPMVELGVSCAIVASINRPGDPWTVTYSMRPLMWVKTGVQTGPIAPRRA